MTTRANARHRHGRSWRIRVQAVLGICLVAVIGVSVFLHSRTSSGSTSQALPDNYRRLDLRLINYYPADAGWEQMWANYNHTQIDSDFAAMATLNARTVRVIVQPLSFGYPNVTPTGAAHLADIIKTAAAHGLRIQLTLFDHWKSYGDLSQSETWLKQLLNGYANDQRIALVEVQNEMDSTDPSAMKWAASVLGFLPKVLPGVPRTLSVQRALNPQGSKGQQPLATMLKTLGPSLLDVIDLHFFGASLSKMAAQIAIARDAGDGRPIFVGETGLPTAQVQSAGSDEAQAQFYRNVAALCRSAEVPPPSPWVLNDFADTVNVPDVSERRFGLRTTAGQWKPAAKVVQQMFNATASEATSPSAAAASSAASAPSAAAVATSRLGTSASAVRSNMQSLEFDGTFAHTNQYPDAMGLLGSWWINAQSLAGGAGIAPESGLHGTPAAFLSKTKGTQSSVPAIAITLPVLGPQTLKAAAYVRCVACSGENQIAISWFGADGYISGAQSIKAPTGTNGWAPIGISATPPAGATSFQLHLKSSHNGGTVYFDDVTITVI